MSSVTALTWLLSLVAVGRVSLIMHELGHAAVSLRQTSGPVVIQVGRAQNAKRISFGRLHLAISWSGSGGICRFRPDRPLSRGAQLKRVLAGPAVNVALALLLGAIALRTHGLVRTVILSGALSNALIVVVSLVPHHSRGGVTHGKPSDGLKAWSLLRGKPIPPPPAATDRPAKAAPRRGRPLGGRIGIGLAIGVVGSLALAHRIPAYAALVVIPAVIVVYAALGDLAAGSGGAKPARPAPTRGPSSPSTSSTVSRPPMKRCPSCGAQVHQRTKLCYCYHQFS